MPNQSPQVPATLDRVDSLTLLPGQQAFLDAISKMACEKRPCEIMILGIDHFKALNNQYGYAFGDKILRYLAEELRAGFPADTPLYRLYGDCFGLLCQGPETGLCEKLYSQISQRPRKLDGLSVSLTISAGICQCPEHGADGDTLFTNASLALAQAKLGAKGRCVYYWPDLSQKAMRDTLLLERLRHSIENNFAGFTLYYQPIVRSDSKQIYGCEALLRWQDAAFPEGVSPYLFVPSLEESGMIWEVGQWVIHTALAQCAKWQRLMPGFNMNINAAASQFEDSRFPEMVVQALKQYDIPPNTITLELTESGRGEFSSIRDAFDYLRKQGLQTALDDFGTGYASVDIFRQISADELKIDRSFLERVTNDVTDQILIKSIIDMCKKMDIMVCVEGVENADIENIIAQMEPHVLQGYHYSRPLPAAQFEQQYLQSTVLAEKQDKTLSPVVYQQHRPAQPMTYSAIVNNAYAGIFQVGMDEQFTFLTCNEGYRRMLGYTSQEMEEKFGNKALGFVYPDDMAWVNEEIRRQLGMGDTVNIEFRVVRSDGRPIWILGTGNVVRSSGGNPSLIVNIVENDRRKRENLEKEQKLAQYETILAQLPTGIKYIRYDPDFTIEYISPGFLSILGFTLQEVMEDFEGKYINLIYEEDRQQVFNDALEQVQKSDVVMLRYRSVCKDGRLIWVETVSRLCPMDEDGIQRCCSSVVDVTETITPEEQSRALNIQNRLQSASQVWGEVVFEYNFITGQMAVSESFTQLFGHTLPPNGLIAPADIFKQNKGVFMAQMEPAQKGEAPAPFEIEAFCENGKPKWCQVMVHPSGKIGEEMVSAIGKILDIDKEHAERERLRRASQTDSLTQLYNKRAIELKIGDMLQAAPETPCACWILDVDNFKNINDTLGHFAGDVLLQEIAKRLGTAFRKTDILGRAGGDEFLIFAEYNGQADWLQNRGGQVMELLRAPVRLQNKVILPSVSIGISCYPKDGTTFADLYQKADKALYRIKTTTKNDFCTF